MTKRAIRKHGLSRTTEYRAWQTMRLRCLNPENPAYADYGGRGIWVCARWLDSPENFLADMGQKPSAKHEIDRVDNDKGYTCGHCDDCKARGAVANCRWVTRGVNDRNRRSNRMLKFRGETRPLVEWCELLGLGYGAVSKRLSSGSSVEEALSTPVRPKAPNGSRPKPVPRAPGELGGRTKYSAELVAQLRAERADGASPAALAKRYGISKKYVGKLTRGERRGGLVGVEGSAAA